VDFYHIREDLERLAGPVAGADMRRLECYADALVESSGTMNLMSKGAIERLGEHVLDSAALLSFIDLRGKEFADLGSGAGLPGVVVAVLRSETRVTLVDSRRSKVVFLKRAARLLELGNVRVVHERIEHLVGREVFDVAAVRALEKSVVMLPACLDLVRPTGSLVLFKGPGWEGERTRAEELAAGRGFSIARSEVVPLGKAQRTTTLVEFHVKQPDM
jgi:16S rRNA (guanine527-N7)-methyltransferase